MRHRTKRELAWLRAMLGYTAVYCGGLMVVGGLVLAAFYAIEAGIE